MEHLPYGYDDGSDDGASPDECVEFASKEITELRADVERLLERVTDHAAKFESGLNVLRQERDEACAECESLRKQVSMLNMNCATHYEHGRKVGRWLDEAIEQRDEARAEVERLRWLAEAGCENTPTKNCECPGCCVARERADRGEA